MRSRGTRTLTALGAVVVTLGMLCAVAAADYLPTPPSQAALQPTDVAVVENTHILQSEYDRIMTIYKTQDAPPFTAAEERKGRKQIMTSLISRTWYALEAAQLGIVVTDQQVLARFSSLKRQTFPDDSDYRLFLKNTGQTEQDLLNLVRSTLLMEAVQDPWNGTVTVTSREIGSEFRKRSSRYDRPASRDLHIIFTARRKKARKARAALAMGQSFKTVAKRYSEDAYTKHKGGRFPGVTRGQFEPPLDRAVFKAKRGEIVGPVKTEFGYYVFTVTRIHPRTPRTLAQARSLVRNTLKERKERANRRVALQAFEARWKPATLCRLAYVTDDCGLSAP